MPPRWQLRAIDLLILLGLVACGILLAGDTLATMKMLGVISLLAAPVFLLLAFSARSGSQPGLGGARLFYSFLTMSLVLAFAPRLGLTNAVDWSLQGALIQGLVAACMMATLLYQRSRVLQRHGQQNALDLALAQQALGNKQMQLGEQQNFMDMLTHEIRNPLATLQLTLDTLPMDESKRQRLNRAMNDMDAIIERCRQTEQMEQGRLSASLQSCDLTALLQETIRASSDPARIHLNISMEAATVLTDVQLLRIAITNLLGNALKYSDPESPVKVEVSASGKGVCLTVSSSSGTAGLPDPVQLFTKYYRSPRAHSKSGSGLGLYLVRGIMQKLGGQISYTPCDNLAHFALWLPQ